MLRLRSAATALPLLFLCAGCDALFGGPAKSTCIQDRNLPLSTFFVEEIANTDCQENGAAFDQYNLALTSPTTLSLAITMDGVIGLTTSISRITGGTPQELVQQTGSTARTTYVALGPGDYTVRIIASAETERGQYSLTANPIAPPGPVGCVTSGSQLFYLARGSVQQGGITASDCDAANGAKVDHFAAELKAGESYSFTLAPAVDATLEVIQGTVVQKTQAVAAGANATVTFTPTSTSAYIVRVTSAGSGNYTLTLQ